MYLKYTKLNIEHYTSSKKNVTTLKIWQKYENTKSLFEEMQFFYKNAIIYDCSLYSIDLPTFSPIK